MSGITVVKIGGSTLGSHDTSLADIAALHQEGHRFVVVHGGGSTISEWLKRHGVDSRFVRGLRVTDEATLDVVVAVLGGLVNKRLVAELQALGARATGLSGADDGLLRARRYDPELGFVGEVTEVAADSLRAAVEAGSIAVVAPLAIEVDGEAFQPQLLNVNADTAAGELAAALAAERLVFLTDVAGVMNAGGDVISELGAAEVENLVRDGVVAGGMVPKVKAALRGASSGAQALILDGRASGALRTVFEAGSVFNGTCIK